MSLPNISTPTFTETLPGLNKKVKFRPFLVKDQKSLMLAKTSNDHNAIVEGINTIIRDCTFGELDVSTLPFFDLEFLFVKMRAKSSGEDLELKYKYTYDDNGTEKIVPLSVTVDLNEVKVIMPKEKLDVVEVGEGVYIKMKYPTLAVMKDMDSDIDNIKLLSHCIEHVYDSEQMYEVDDIPQKELEEWIGDFSQSTLEDIKKFFTNMPRLEHKVEVDLPDGNKKVITLRGLNDFFG